MPARGGHAQVAVPLVHRELVEHVAGHDAAADVARLGGRVPMWNLCTSLSSSCPSANGYQGEPLARRCVTEKYRPCSDAKTTPGRLWTTAVVAGVRSSRRSKDTTLVNALPSPSGVCITSQSWRVAPFSVRVGKPEGRARIFFSLSRSSCVNRARTAARSMPFTRHSDEICEGQVS